MEMYDHDVLVTALPSVWEMKTGCDSQSFPGSIGQQK